jgi:hypothetical protein
VPDTQEVFLSKSIENLSLIVEICQSVPPVDLIEALQSVFISLPSFPPRSRGKLLTRKSARIDRFHHSSLALDNAALSTSITSLSPLASSLSSPSSLITLPVSLSSYSKISKFNTPASAADDVSIRMGLWRIESKKIDLIVCVNYPLRERERITGEGEEEEGEKRANELFESVKESLQVMDYGLFA